MNKEVIPKIRLGFYLPEEYVLKTNNSLKQNSLIKLIKFENMYIVESGYSYIKFDNLQEATKEFKTWCNSETEFLKEV